MRMRKKKNLIPRMERCERLLIKDPYIMPGKWRDLYPEKNQPRDINPESGDKRRELRLEIGCGKGGFTAETAKLNPDILLIGLEVVPEAIVVAMERCMDLNPSNAYFIRADAGQLDQFFAPDEIDCIYLNFSDPWPGNRHAKRRLTHGNFLKIYRQILKSGGKIQFKTDNQPLFEFSLTELPKYGFELSDITWNLHEHGVSDIMTDYEAKFYQQGLPICRLIGTMRE